MKISKKKSGLMLINQITYRKFIITIFGFLMVVFSSCEKAIETVEVLSPDENITYKVETKNGKLTYSVFSKDGQIIEKSVLGLNVNGQSISLNSVIKRIENYKLNETYPYRGVHNTAINNFKAAKIYVTSTTSTFVLDVKVFNDGVAFRYLIDNIGDAVINQEFTNFVLPIGSKVWSQSNNKHYEAHYTEKLSEEFKKDEIIGPPATILLPNLKTYIAITESGLTDFAGMSLMADGNRSFKAMLSGDTKKVGNISSPWRIIEIGNDLNTLVNCDIIANVSPNYDKNLFPDGYDTDLG
ncbi:MAG: glycoside hydrolase family 97 N-terminal domain-containing protein [Prolixibacteraceae bacterium]|jgi:alpha-glucosidase|nr:glycoside hydrolase family 97 N-terminal domain-containing protein [Prolixibacteraceae bacterium]